MSKVTSKLQVTIPKAVADRYGIHPGDEVRWEVREPGPMMVPEAAVRPRLTAEERLALFRESVQRQVERQAARKTGGKTPRSQKRDWTRADLYEPPRGLPR